MRNAKFGKDRLIPLHPSTRAALDRYLAARNRLGAAGDDLFVVKHGRAPSKVHVYCVFVRLARALGFRGAPGTRGPRLHDLQTFLRGQVSRSLSARPHGRDAAHAGAEHLHGPRRRGGDLLVSPGDTGSAERHRRRGRARVRRSVHVTPLAPHLTAFLGITSQRERGASQHTIASYADSFALLLRFAADRLKCGPSDLRVKDLDVTLVRTFLDHLESDRGNGSRSRNARFSAIRSFFRYIEYRLPACLEQAMSIRALPIKRTDTRLIDYLSRDEMKALLDAPDPRTHRRRPAQQRDAASGLSPEGLRVSELFIAAPRGLP